MKFFKFTVEEMKSACREVLVKSDDECEDVLQRKLGNLDRFELEQFLNNYTPDGLKYKPKDEGQYKKYYSIIFSNLLGCEFEAWTLTGLVEELEGDTDDMIVIDMAFWIIRKRFNELKAGILIP